MPLDVWGQARATAQAARFDGLSASEQKHYTALLLSQNIASSYWDIALFQKNLDSLNQQVASVASLLEVTVLRQQRSEASSLDVLQQEQQLCS